jgi:hypothetical protein
MFMPLNMFGIQMFMSLNVFNLDGHDVDCFRRKLST